MNHTLKKTIDSSSRNAWPLLAMALIASASAMIFMDSSQQKPWDCEPISPAGASTNKAPCFTATLSGGNRVSLHWKIMAPDSEVYIFDDRPPAYRDPGVQISRCNPDGSGACSTDIQLTEGGSYRWTLSTRGADGKQFNASAQIWVPPPKPPVLTSGGGFVDHLAPQDQYFNWTTNSSANGEDNDAWVEIKTTASFGWPQEKHPRSGPGAQYNVPAETFENAGEYAFLVRDCHIPHLSDHKFCSPAISVGYRVGYDHFTGYRNRHVQPGESIEIGFSTNSGDVRLISSQTLFGSDNNAPIAAHGATITIDTDKVSSGVHELSLNSCLLPDGPCSNRQNAERAQMPSVFWQKKPGAYAIGEVIGTLFPLDGGTPREITAPITGAVYFLLPGPIHLAEAGQLLAYSIAQPADMMRVIVGAPMDWTLDRQYTEDFHKGTALPAIGFGQALDITFDKAGGIWMLNEFSNGVEHISPSGEIHSLGFPIARRQPLQATSAGIRYPPTKPFSLARGTGNIATRTTVSALAEKVAIIDSRLWFTQGGGLLRELSGSPNHSRVISYDPSDEDSPHTPFDDRFCVYNLPAEDIEGLGNAQVIGLAGGRGRIWIAESRGITNQETSYLSSFVPNSKLCMNLLDFDDPAAVAGQPLRYCGDGRSPEQDGCMQRIPMPESSRAVKIAHLQTDPDNALIWFTDASGQNLGSYDLEGEGGVELRPIPETHMTEYDTVGELGGFPWGLQVTHDAVYVSEYASRHILRYDKRGESFSEVSIPYTGRMMRLHSMALDSHRERLWFTLANECAVPGNKAHSTIGYVDLNSWEKHLERPASGRRIQGVIYSGLEKIPACEMHPDKHQSFRGIAVDPQTGKIALSTMLREQITLLEPLPGFWP
ncbi:MAG: hypothetical protein V7720_02890 [Halioglobus sp.]